MQFSEIIATSCVFPFRTQFGDILQERVILLLLRIVTRLVTVDGYWIDSWIYYNRTLKYNTTSLRTPSVLQLTTEYITIPQPS
jgi:hypothetical protein